MTQAISVRFRADTSKFSAGLGKVKSGISSVSNMAKGLVSAFTGVGLGVGGALVYFNKFRKDMDRISKLAETFNDNTDSLQRIALAAQLAGVDLEKVSNGMARLNTAATDATRGTKTYVRALDELGIKAEDVLQADMYKRLVMLGEAYNNANNKARAQANLLAILGRSGRDLVPLLTAMGDKASGLRVAADTSTIVSADVIQKMVAFNDNLVLMGQNLKVLFSGLVGNIAAAADYLHTAFDMGLLGALFKESVVGTAKQFVVIVGAGVGAAFAASTKFYERFADHFMIGLKASAKMLPDIGIVLKNILISAGAHLLRILSTAAELIANVFGKDNFFIKEMRAIQDDMDNVITKSSRETLEAQDRIGIAHYLKLKEVTQMYSENRIKDAFRNAWDELQGNLGDKLGVNDHAGNIAKMDAEIRERMRLQREALKNLQDKLAGNMDLASNTDTKKTTTEAFKPVVSSLQRIGGASGLTGWGFNPMVREQKRTNDYLDGIQEALNEKPNMQFKPAWQ